MSAGVITKNTGDPRFARAIKKRYLSSDGGDTADSVLHDVITLVTMDGVPILPGGVVDDTGVYFHPDSCAHALAYAGGLVATDTASDGVTSWVKTYSYSGSDLVGESKWVRQ